MQPTALVTILAGSWVLLHFWLLPLTRDRWKAGDMSAKMACAGRLVILEELRGLAAVGVVAVGCVILMVALGGWLAASSMALPEDALGAASVAHQLLKGIADNYGVALGIAGCVGAAIAFGIAARLARRRVAQVWSGFARQTCQALHDNPSLIEKARSDPDLLPMVQSIDRILTSLRLQDGQGEPCDIRLRERLQAALDEELWTLAIEIARKRVDFAAAAVTPGSSEQAAATTPVRRLVRELASDRYARDLGLERKPLSRVVLALLLVSLVGWSADPLADSLRQAVDSRRVNPHDAHARHDIDVQLPGTPGSAASCGASSSRSYVAASQMIFSTKKPGSEDD